MARCNHYFSCCCYYYFINLIIVNPIYTIYLKSYQIIIPYSRNYFIFELNLSSQKFIMMIIQTYCTIDFNQLFSFYIMRIKLIFYVYLKKITLKILVLRYYEISLDNKSKSSNIFFLFNYFIY